MDIQTYLDRIDFHGTIEVSENVLYWLQKKHLLNIPFENLDIHYDRNISLSITDIYQKIVVEKRGGFCYELNGLFHQLLKQIGFKAKLISARVFIKNDQYSPEYDHLAIIISIENQDFLVDVGFGEFSFEPLKFEMNQEISDSFGQFQFEKYSSKYYSINEIKSDKLIPQYIFSMKKRELSEFEERCRFHQTSKDSHFSKKKLISIAKEEGRITLNNSRLKITSKGIEEEVKFKEDEFEAMLKQYFNISL